MDINNLSDRKSEYFKNMGILESRQIYKTADLCSRKLKNHVVRSYFNHDIREFCNNQLSILLSNNSSDSDRSKALSYLKEERTALANQNSLLSSGRAELKAIIEITKKNEIWVYVLKGIGVIAGAVQVVAGVGILSATGVTGLGTIAGATLIVHGLGNFEENLRAIKNRDVNYRGYLRRGYGLAARTLGYDNNMGDIIYGGVDILSSGYGLLRQVLKPEAWRLFKYINNDFIVGYKQMSGYSLGFEILSDGITLKSIHDGYNN